MPPQWNPRALRPGDVLTADYLNGMMRAIQDAGALRVGSGLTSRRGPGGLQIAAVGSRAYVVGIADANIPPRSGATAGAGVLRLVNVDPLTRAIVETGGNLDVVNLSTTTMSTGVSIAAGLYCEAFLIDGAWSVVPLECGS